METLLFWIAVAAAVTYFKVTTANQRERWFYHMLTAVTLFGATGFVWGLIT